MAFTVGTVASVSIWDEAASAVRGQEHYERRLTSDELARINGLIIQDPLAGQNRVSTSEREQRTSCRARDRRIVEGIKR